MSNDWSTAYEKYVDDVYRFLMYFLKNPHDADDLTQETFIRAYRQWDTIRDYSKVKVWLLQVAKNLAFELSRHQKRQSLLRGFMERHGDEPLAMPDEIIQSEEDRQELYGILKQIPLPYRVVIVLRGIQEHTPTETAEILNWSINKVNLTYHRALKTLRKRLEKEVVFHELASHGSKLY